MSETPAAENDAGHDAHCEREYTSNGFIFIDCLCRLRSAQAQAWDEGYSHCFGEFDGVRSLNDNPYRATEPADD